MANVASPRLVPRSRFAWRSIARIIGIVLAALLILYVGMSYYLATVSTQGVRRPLEGSPADVGLQYESVSFSAEDGVPLRGWFLPANGTRAIVMVHGLDGNRWSAKEAGGLNGYKNYGPTLSKDLVNAGFNLLQYDARWAGESGGDRLGLGYTERNDVKGAVKYLENRGFKAGSIALYGSSYGAATVLVAAAEIPDIAAVVADSAFADPRELLSQEIQRRTGFPPVFTPGIVVWARMLYGLELEKAPALLAVPKIAPRPILFIHGQADSRIPYSHSERLKATSTNPLDELYLIPGANHTLGYQTQPDILPKRVISFLDKYVRP